jgi:hypothetical protein
MFGCVNQVEYGAVNQRTNGLKEERRQRRQGGQPREGRCATDEQGGENRAEGGEWQQPAVNPKPIAEQPPQESRSDENQRADGGQGTNGRPGQAGFFEIQIDVREVPANRAEVEEVVCARQPK